MSRSLPERATEAARRVARSRARPIARALVPRRGRDALRALRKRAQKLAYRGDRVECPCCESRWRRFLPSWNRPNAICPECRSHERHRGLWLFLKHRHPELFTDELSLLHFAPEDCFKRPFGSLPRLRWTTADLDAPDAMEHFDITAIPHPDGCFDAIICSHVLEHVTDDRRAMSELARILKPDGWAIVMVPLDAGRAATYEDPAVLDPADRKREFWQEDHVRLYGRDFPERLRAAGFEVHADRFLAELEPALRQRFVTGADEIFVCRPART